MTDIVHYKIPFWFIGDIANVIIVQKQLAEIFKYRYKIVQEKYGQWNDEECKILFK